MSMNGILGIRCFREWLGLFAEDVLQSIMQQEYSFSITEECLVSVRYAVLDELRDTASAAMDLKAMRSIGMSVDPAGSNEPGIMELGTLKTLVDRLKSSGKDAFEDTAPFLRGKLEAKAESSRLSILEMLRRTDEHRFEIERSILNGKQLQRIQKIKRIGSLLYPSGRIVTEIVTDCGRIVYKPRDLRIDKWFMELAKTYTGNLICIPETLCCGESYGFTEYVENESVDMIRLIPENAYALGALCVMIYVTGVSDLHKGNVFVSKGMICLPDLEIILLKDKYTEIPSSIRHLTDIFRKLICAEEDAFFAGIADTYRRCMADREMLSHSVEMTYPFWIRDMIRGGGQYKRLVRIFHQLEAIHSPEERLADEKDMEWVLRETAAKDRKAFSDAELEHIIRGSYTVLSVRAGARDAYCDGKLLIKDYIPQSPIEITVSLINNMKEQELQQIITDLRRYINRNEE